jgi:hypothetical protein
LCFVPTVTKKVVGVFVRFRAYFKQEIQVPYDNAVRSDSIYWLIKSTIMNLKILFW